MVAPPRALKILLVGMNADSSLPVLLTGLGWIWEAVALDTWFSTPGLPADAALIDAGARSPDSWLRIHHLVSRVPYPLVLVTDGAVPSSFHYARAGGLRVALLPAAPHADLLRSTVSLARQNYQMVRLEPDPEWDGGSEMADVERRESVLASVRRIRQELESVQTLLEPETGDREPAQPLGEREWEVKDLLLKGLAIGVIAERLGIAESTVKKHIHAIYRKRGVSNRAQLMAEG